MAMEFTTIQLEESIKVNGYRIRKMDMESSNMQIMISMKDTG
jgi:hypothetical protein